MCIGTFIQRKEAPLITMNVRPIVPALAPLGCRDGGLQGVRHMGIFDVLERRQSRYLERISKEELYDFWLQISYQSSLTCA
jgi:hypothetical protein